MPYDPLADRHLVRYLPKGWEIRGGVFWKPESTKVITATRIPRKRLDPPTWSRAKETVRIFPIRPDNPVYDGLRPWAIPGKQPYGIVVGRNRPTSPDFRSIKPVIYHTKFSHIEPPTRLKWMKQVQTNQLNNYAKGIQNNYAKGVQTSPKYGLSTILAERLAQRRHRSELEQYLGKYYDGFRALDQEALADDLVQKLSEKKSSFVEDVLDNINDFNKDDVSLEMLKRASTKTLKDVAKREPGRDVILRLVRELHSGSTFKEEVSMMQKGMRAVTSIKTGKPLTIEVITYSKGIGDVLGAIADYFRGRRMIRNPLRGHTTLVINDYAYSFEPGGWSAGYTKDQYLGLEYNRGRAKKGQIQTLRVDPKDIARLQDYMLSLVGTDQWGIKGQVCTTSTGKVLQKILNVEPTYSPLGFAEQLSASGLVIGTYPASLK
jgi:hypothetical protein